ncbi:hypothetical protein M0R45_030192 [Rubus argutus]|uniref:C3H1-type domain-containing protein n=1 Tax=Rubus argutus TaxID=59490 RepID=A0AAW1WEB4_RUBAR
MMDTRKRGRHEAGGFHANGGFKKNKQELDSLSTGVGSKSKPCTKFSGSNLCLSNTAGCPFGESCHFLHYVPGGYNAVAQSYGHDDPRAMAPAPGRNWMEPGHAPLAGPASSFGASSTAKISVDASLAGAIIGKGGVNSKHICRQTGAKLSIRDHESDPNLRNIELEGTFEQIQQASALLCDNFAKGTCTFGERCHFAHGAAELRKSGV